MHKMTILAIAVAATVASPVLAEENGVTFREGDAYLITPDGTMYKSIGKVSDAHHNAALKQGAAEVGNGTVFYQHGGKLYGVRCTGPYIGGWKQGYPGTENFC